MEGKLPLLLIYYRDYHYRRGGKEKGYRVTRAIPPRPLPRSCRYARTSSFTLTLFRCDGTLFSDRRLASDGCCQKKGRAKALPRFLQTGYFLRLPPPLPPAPLHAPPPPPPIFF